MHPEAASFFLDRAVPSIAVCRHEVSSPHPPRPCCVALLHHRIRHMHRRWQVRANSTYEANLRRLASTLPAEISSSLQGIRALWYWPHRLRATWECYGGASSCSACIAGGFKESEGECPNTKEFVFYGRDCYLHLADFRAFERFFRPTLTQSIAAVLALQAVAFAYLLFLFLQEWRQRTRGDSI